MVSVINDLPEGWNPRPAKWRSRGTNQIRGLGEKTRAQPITTPAQEAGRG